MKTTVLNYAPPAGSPLAEATTVILPRVVDADATRPAPVVPALPDLTPAAALALADRLVRRAAHQLGQPAEGLLADREWWLAYATGWKDAEAFRGGAR